MWLEITVTLSSEEEEKNDITSSNAHMIAESSGQSQAQA